MCEYDEVVFCRYKRKPMNHGNSEVIEGKCVGIDKLRLGIIFWYI